MPRSRNGYRRQPNFWAYDVWFAYNEDVIDALKQDIPSSARKWNPEEKLWRIDASWWATAQQILNDYGIELEDESMNPYGSPNDSPYSAYQNRSNTGQAGTGTESLHEMERRQWERDRKAWQQDRDGWQRARENFENSQAQWITERGELRRRIQQLEEAKLKEELRQDQRRGRGAHVDPAWAVLHVEPGAPFEVVSAAYRALAARHHPDHGGDVERMKRINLAFERITALRK